MKLFVTGACAFNFIFMVGCDEKPKDDGSVAKQDAALSALASNLNDVDNEFVPESLKVSNSQSKSQSKLVQGKTKEDDICEDGELFDCQPKLLKFYVKTARETFRFSRKLILDIAHNMGSAPDGSSGVIKLKDGITVEYNKKSFLKFDLLLKEKGQSIGYISVKNGEYDIRLDMDVIDKANPDSNGGLFEIAVKFTDRKHWQTNLHITNTHCDESDPSDPEALRIEVNRNDTTWVGQSTIYSPRATIDKATVSCSSPVDDSTAIVMYTDFVGNSTATKSALYMMRRNETSTAQINEYGIDGLCTKYPDLCQSLGLQLGYAANVAGTEVANYLGQFSNPFCVQHGSSDVIWNSDCSSSSAEVGSASFRANSDWITPSDFYQMSVELPDSLN